MSRSRRGSEAAGDVRESSEWPIVQDAIARAAGISSQTIDPKADLLMELQMDSLAVFEVAIDLEAAYDMKIPDEEIEELSTAEDVVRYIEARLADD